MCHKRLHHNIEEDSILLPNLDPITRLMDILSIFNIYKPSYKIQESTGVDLNLKKQFSIAKIKSVITLKAKT